MDRPGTEGSPCLRVPSGSMDLVTALIGDSLRRRVKEAVQASSASYEDY